MVNYQICSLSAEIVTNNLVVSNGNSVASRDSDGGSDGDHSALDHQIAEVT